LSAFPTISSDSPPEYLSAVSTKLIQRLVDDADRVVVIRVADGSPEHHGAERVGADLNAGPAEGAVVHAGSPELCGREVAGVSPRCRILI